MRFFPFLVIALVLRIIPCQAQEMGTFTDPRDGQTYKTVKIGERWWMAQNLAYIPRVYPVNSEEGIYVYNFRGYDPDSAMKTVEYQTYGCLYSWKLASTVCPEGWHLPTDEEWKLLERSLGMSLSESDSVNWRRSGRVDLKIMSAEWGNDNQGNNVSGFSALPGGISFTNEYMPDTIFGLIREAADFWTSTAANDKKAWTRGVYVKTTGLGRGPYYYCDGLSVRCVRN